MRRDVRVVGRGRRARAPSARLVALALAAALVAGCGSSADAPRPTGLPTGAGSSDAAGPTELDDYAEALVEATAAARRAAGVDAVETSACAARAATDRARALIGRPLAHASLAPVLLACAPASTAAENLSRAPAAAGGPLDVVDAWLASPGHRANLLDPGLTAVGAACVRDDTGTGAPQVLCAQVFLGP